MIDLLQEHKPALKTYPETPAAPGQLLDTVRRDPGRVSPPLMMIFAWNSQ